MITPSFGLTATERVLPKLALDFTTASLDSRVTFTRTTDATHPATYVNNAGAITAATNNQPRFDYDPVTLVCKGLLIEESRTNSLLNTNLLSTQIVTVTAAVRTLSFYGTGSVTLSGAHTAIVSGTGAYPTRTTYSFTPTAGALTLTVTGTVQYAQLEVGAFATSYIPTTSAALTRNADVAVMTGTNFSSWWNASEGTFVTNANGKGYAIMQVDNGTTNSFAMRFIVGASAMQIYDATTLTCQLGTTVAGTDIKISGAYKLNDAVCSIAGGTALTDTSTGVPVANALVIGARNTLAPQSFLNGVVAKVLYYPQRLTNAEVQAFSK